VALKRQTIQTPWLRWLGSDQLLASGFERDLVGLSGYTSGNGIEARYLRSASGDLARVVYRHTQARQPRAALQARHGPQGGGATPLMGRSTQETIERLLGIAPAHAQAHAHAALPSAPAGSASPASPTSAADLPGALGSPADPQALIDHRYLWSAGGHLLHSQQRAGSTAQQTQHSHAYNARGQLVASVQASLGVPAQSSGGLSPVSLNEAAPAQANQKQAEQEAQEQSVWRYAYDASQRRLLSQQGGAEQSDLTSHTRRSAFMDGSHRLNFGHEAGSQPTTYNANGQPERVGSREFVWDALGRLIEVREESKPLAPSIARYQYDHRGLRIGKQLGQQTTQTHTTNTTQTLYDESRQPLAELDAQGRITRQYVWLADMPLAVIDTPQGQALAAEAPGLSQLWADVRSAINSWLGTEAGIAWLHTNHLGAPEAATNAQGQLVWRARYAPFGAARVSSTQSGFTLHLRLPGQVFDAETGLHYNRQRYYDPEHGQYLTPDPLGTPDGPNPYAYVAFNPLTNIDPDGLVLFAFDGTGNDESNPNELTNVVRFRELYRDGDSFYITGPGTLDPRTNIGPTTAVGRLADSAISRTGQERIARLILDLQEYSSRADVDDNTAVDIDIVGFSRGAAQARDFANRIVANTRDGLYRYTEREDGREVERCQRVNFRFMGLWDTVLSTHSGSYNLAIPGVFTHVAQAVALNEYRNLFPVESIMAGPYSSAAVPGQTRIERGFLGSHSDIGGSFSDGDLAKVAMLWMVNQASAAGVTMGSLSAEQTSIIANPVLHDRSRNLFANNGPAPTQFGEDRVIRWRDGSTQRQRTTSINGVGYADVERYINYSPNPTGDTAGTVDMRGYLDWLGRNGYGITLTVN